MWTYATAPGSADSKWPVFLLNGTVAWDFQASIHSASNLAGTPESLIKTYQKQLTKKNSFKFGFGIKFYPSLIPAMPNMQEFFPPALLVLPSCVLKCYWKLFTKKIHSNNFQNLVTQSLYAWKYIGLVIRASYKPIGGKLRISAIHKAEEHVCIYLICY